MNTLFQTLACTFSISILIGCGFTGNPREQTSDSELLNDTTKGSELKASLKALQIQHSGTFTPNLISEKGSVNQGLVLLATIDHPELYQLAMKTHGKKAGDLSAKLLSRNYEHQYSAKMKSEIQPKIHQSSMEYSGAIFLKPVQSPAIHQLSTNVEIYYQPLSKDIPPTGDLREHVIRFNPEYFCTHLQLPSPTIPGRFQNFQGYFIQTQKVFCSYETQSCLLAKDIMKDPKTGIEGPWHVPYHEFRKSIISECVNYGTQPQIDRFQESTTLSDFNGTTSITILANPTSKALFQSIQIEFASQ